MSYPQKHMEETWERLVLVPDGFKTNFINCQLYTIFSSINQNLTKNVPMLLD